MQCVVARVRLRQLLLVLWVLNLILIGQLLRALHTYAALRVAVLLRCSRENASCVFTSAAKRRVCVNGPLVY